MGSSPLNIGAFDAAPNWAENLGDLGSAPDVRSAKLPQSRKLELGNLAALEDDVPSAKRKRASVEPMGYSPEEVARRTGGAETAPGEPEPEALVPPTKAGGMMKTTLLVALLLMLLLIVGAAGVVLGGRVP